MRGNAGVLTEFALPFIGFKKDPIWSQFIKIRGIEEILFTIPVNVINSLIYMFCQLKYIKFHRAGGWS